MTTKPNFRELEDVKRKSIKDVSVTVHFFIDVDYTVNGKLNGYTIPNRFNNKVVEGNLAEVSLKAASVAASIGKQFSSDEIMQMTIEDEILSALPPGLVLPYINWSDEEIT